MQQLVQLSHGLLPYRDFAYSYPPLFLLVLYPFYLIGGASFAAVPIVVSDAATAVVIFYFVERFAGKRLALLSGLAYSLSPFALYYEGYVWFSSQPMTFFAVLSVYLITRNKVVSSLSALAIAILFKQEAVFLLPAVLFLSAYRGRKRFLAGVTAFSSTVIAVSFPFFLISPRDYLSEITYELLGRWHGTVPTALATASTAACQTGFQNSPAPVVTCASAGTALSSFATNAPSVALLADSLSYDLNVVSGLVVIPMFLLLIPLLIAQRKNQQQFFNLVCVWSGIGLLILFSVILHPTFKYYYLPIYAIMLMGVVDKKTFAVAVTTPVVSLATPSGAFQELLPILAMIAIAAILDFDSRRSGEPLSSGPSPVAAIEGIARPSPDRISRDRLSQTSPGRPIKVGGSKPANRAIAPTRRSCQVDT